MNDQTSNLLGAVGLAVADRIETVAKDVLGRSGETPAALVVIGYGLGPSNDHLRRVLGLSHPGTVRLVDRLVGDGLVERREASDRRAIALYLTKKGEATREQLLKGRLIAIRHLVDPLNETERATLSELLNKILIGLDPTDMQRRTLCRMCDRRICQSCPIPADLQEAR